MSQKVVLYYAPGSYYSQKVFLSLFEKGIEFDEHIINILAEEQNAEWYLKINSWGEVPVLKLGDTYYTESENIIDVVDSTFHSGPRLVPDVETELGADVRHLRELLDDIPVDVITYGVSAHRKYITNYEDRPWLINRFTRKRIDSSWTAREDEYRRQLLTCKPELRECFEKKLGRSSRRHARVLDENDVGKCLDNLEPVFDKLEERIQKTAKENESGQETWLFGPEFTAADITLAVLMIRLTMVGVSRRFFSIEKRNGVFDYYIRMNKKPTIIKAKEKMYTMTGIVVRQKLRAAGKVTLKIGAVIALLGIGYLGCKEISKILSKD
ncbi:ganglioside-induced differentiation-associated protein 1-like [Mya arenaria]|uniref:ganglioside-induced differentiation-associated protein 1-like n=1 Tax=Mya arenaria TaxID=6604 RepID=UPI0022E71ECE|nr:ganglioside-induced differentiation-associated protein 1-like [Mya arenaria]